jgi:hypothetical protein
MKLTVFLHVEGVGAILEQIDSSTTSEGATKMPKFFGGQEVNVWIYSRSSSPDPGYRKAKIMGNPIPVDGHLWVEFPSGQVDRFNVGDIRAIKPPKQSNGISRFVVMTGSAQMPSSCWGHYKRVAVVETDLAEGQPRFIGERAKGLVRIVETWERRNVGKTKRCAYRKALLEAQTLADKLNQKEQHNEES